MRTIRLFATLMAVAVLLGAWAGTALAQQQFQLVTGKAFDSAVPKDFYVEGNAIPTEKRNATLVLLPSGKRALFAPIDTTGYASDVASKYVGMIVTEGDVSICGQKVGVGSYGFGWVRPARGEEGAGTFKLYDQAGVRLVECPSARDAELKQPRPMQVTVKQDGTARLYFGRHSVELK
jgi:hypothetical protein